jgi:hypothetical protein
MLSVVSPRYWLFWWLCFFFGLVTRDIGVIGSLELLLCLDHHKFVGEDGMLDMSCGKRFLELGRCFHANVLKFFLRWMLEDRST